MEELEPYDPKYFDYRRYYERQQSNLQTKGSNDDEKKRSNAKELSNLDTLLKLDVMATADETTIEARSLIQQWMEGGKFEPEDYDFGFQVEITRESNSPDKTRILQEARRIIGEVSIRDTVVPACRDLGLGMEVRRKRIQRPQHTTKTKDLNLEKIQSKKSVLVTKTKSDIRLERAKQKILEQVLAAEIREELNHIAPAVECTSNPIVSETLSLESSKQAARAKISQLEHQKKLEASYRFAEILYQKSCLRLERRIFSGWEMVVAHKRLAVETFTEKKRFLSHSEFFLKWKKLTNTKLAKRQLHVEMELVRIETRNGIKADLHYKLNTQSKWLNEWRRYVESEKIEREVREQTRRRKEGIQSYLKKLEQNFVCNQQKAISVAIKIDALPQTLPIEAGRIPIVNTGDQTNTITKKNRPSLQDSVVDKYIAKPKRNIPTDVVFLQNFQKREEERKLRREKAALARQEREKEKELEKRREIEAKQEQERMEKALLLQEKERIEEEAKRLLELRQIQKRRDAELNAKACNSNQHRLLLHYGLRPWIAFIELRQQDMVCAIRYNQRSIKYAILRVWKRQYARKEHMKLKAADKVYARSILLNTWTRIRIIQKGIQMQLQLADHHHRSKVMKERFLNYLHTARNHQKKRAIHESIQNSKADQIAMKLVPKRFLRLWRINAQSQKEERWRNYRIERMREVAKVIPFKLECSAYKQFGKVEAFSRNNLWTSIRYPR
jgi:hypothetical protein